jgi:hypothetical protein
MRLAGAPAFSFSVFAEPPTSIARHNPGGDARDVADQKCAPPMPNSPINPMTIR